MNDAPRAQLPVAIIGAGPVGLAAAAHLLTKGKRPIVFEAGASVGANMLDWGHVRVFSPWRYVVDEAAADLLRGTGWTAPDGEGYPTGQEIVEQYLRPLADTAAMRPCLRLNSRVLSVSRAGIDKLKDDGRQDMPFQVVVEAPDGEETVTLARAVIDASGTTATPNPLGAGGVPALGERRLRDRITYGIPDVLGEQRETFASTRTLVVGSGHSAFNVILDLIDLADQAPGTMVTWAIRRPGDRLGNLFGGGSGDALPARGALGERVRRLVEMGRLRLVTGFRVARLTGTAEGVMVGGDDEVIGPVDRIIATTGFRPDLSLLSELRLNLDPAVESPATLAPLIDPNVHSCGSVPPHGEAELRQPEPGLYIAGMKSYGRAPTFLMLTGYEQVRSIACALTGDAEGARDVRLVLPETGVCSSNILADLGVACCAPAGLQNDDVAAIGVSASALPVNGSSVATDPVSTGGGACCAPQAPQVIQLTATRRGGCC